MTLFDIEPEPGETKGAILSDDGHYRYGLVRRWAPDGPVATFIMLNPSTADGTVDDPTIVRCRGFAKSWGCAALHVANLYSWRATNPKVLWTVEDPVGPETNRHLASHALMARRTGWPIIAAWGVNARPERVEQVLRLPNMDRLECLGTSKGGAPLHPLYLRADTPRVPWP